MTKYIANCDLCILYPAKTQVLLNNEKTNLCEKCYRDIKILGTRIK